MSYDPAAFAFDPNNRRTWPPEYARALDINLGSAGVRLICRHDHRGIDVWDVWDMRPARLRQGQAVCKAQGIEDEEHAKRAAEDVYANKKIVVMGGKTWRPRRVGRLTEGVV